MANILKVVKYFAIGVLLGSFSFLLIILLGGEMMVSPKGVLSLFFFSGLIGIVSMIFEAEWFNFPIRLLIHLLITIVIVGMMMYFAGWWNQVVAGHVVSFLTSVGITYIGVWVMLYLADVINTKKMNAVLRKRKSK
ncbi:DUF3021 domain-containing protein [Companilactobacillus heilongjiangensis]|uniref:DUF3021 domain-containing protein n=1 Tax=Companilactobacillus heilongjiangensis TaxID=1074467 RepID=A0A0K2L9G1_9LACO|nr:DUF3021 domain-containing protein [Companilactobacillus heilongjiangensis]ALB27937.1 hypothetical protein JP39_00285 [Companilactobacillus heilongjiangensis]